MRKSQRKKGRPSVITEKVLQKLEEGFTMGYTDEEACMYADISESTLYNFCAEHSDFLERKELLKKTLSMHAKRNISIAIKKGDIRHSIWWLERKNNVEFSTDPRVNPPAQKKEIISERGRKILIKLAEMKRKEMEPIYKEMETFNS